jgi:hypothetical protein
MTDEERRVITAFVERIAGAQQPQQGNWGGGSVPQNRPSLPPVDPEADRMLWELFNRYPEARYRITQTAFVQEAALVEAQNRIQRLEWEVENARRQGQAVAAQASQPRGMFGGMFGGGGRPSVPQPAPMPPPPQPVYPPGYNPAALQQAPGRQGSGFLGTAVMTAAGVAGGLVLGNMLMNSLSGGGANAAGLGGGGGGFGQQPVAQSWGGDAGGNKDASPWAGGDGGSSSGAWSQTPDAAPEPSNWGGDAQPDHGGYAQPDNGGGWAQDDYRDAGGGYDGGGGDWGGGTDN